MQLGELQNGRYRSLNLIGSGSMGDVYLAEDTRIHRQVAIKVIRSEAILYPENNNITDAARLFEQEARTIAIFNHPNILPLYDFGEELSNDVSLMYMVMPLCPDGSLATLLRQRSNAGSLSTQDIMHLISQAANALQHAHDRQIVHRDVKPSNFLIRNNREEPNRPDLLLADFGIAKFAAGTTNSSRTIRGTPIYMAPELWNGAPVPASDQYALAVMAYEMLVGRTPFQGSLEQMMYQHIHGQPSPPSQLNASLSSEVDTVFSVALAKRPEDRFVNISAFARALSQSLLHTSTVHSSTNPEQTIAATPTSNTIRATLAISTVEAIDGTRRTLTLPNGQQVNVSVPAGISNGQVLRLDGLIASSPTGASTDALLLTILVTNPQIPASFTDTSSASPTMIGPHPFNASPSYNAPPYYNVPPSLPTTTRPKRQALAQGMTILLIVLALLVIGGSAVYFAPILLKHNSTPITPTAAANVTVHINATSTAQNTPIAPTQPVVTPTAVPQNPYGGRALVLNDPLLDNSQGNGWLTGQNARGATCEFRADGYYSTEPAQGFFHSCIANNTDFSNFAFEVQATLISGDYVGIIFCNATADTYYLFRVGTDGSYALLRYDLADTGGLTLANGTISANLSASNLIAAVVSGGNIQLYLNSQLLSSVSDNTFTHGRIAVFSWNMTGNTSEARFRNAKVWTL